MSHHMRIDQLVSLHNPKEVHFNVCRMDDAPLRDLCNIFYVGRILRVTVYYDGCISGNSSVLF